MVSHPNLFKVNDYGVRTRILFTSDLVLQPSS